MNIWPVIVRELRAEARNPWNYWLRIVGAGMLLAVFWYLSGISDLSKGDEIFSFLSVWIFIGIWVVVPILVSDCISREKREGTLGLLFLTPLTATEIVQGKSILHLLRASTLIIATIPILTVPFVLGGISQIDVFRTLLLHGTALALSAASGILASSLCRSWTRALILAEILCLCFGFCFLYLPLVVISMVMGEGHISLTGAGVFLLGSVWRSGASSNPVFNVVLWLFLFSVLGFLSVVSLSSNYLRRNWQDKPRSRAQLWLHETFCTPYVLTDLFHRWNRHQLSKNPIGWLQQYSWSARLSKWGWSAVIILLVSWAVGGRGIDENIFYFLQNGLVVSMAFSAVTSFQREKQTGALELLLVTGLTEKQIILGRLKGIWSQFAPAYTLLLMGWLMVLSFERPSYYSSGPEALPILFAATWDFIVIPIIGLYFAMRLKSFLAAWLLTCLAGIVLPGVAAFLVLKYSYMDYGEEFTWIAFIHTIILTILGGVAGNKLYQRLKNRTFAFVRG